MKARKLQKELNYIDWRNFHSLIKRASNLICHGIEKGSINKINSWVSIGSGAKRSVIDYEIDADAEQLIKKLGVSYKLNKSYAIRNEANIFSLLQKFCEIKKIDYEFQFKLNDYFYDFRFKNCLIEFDEPHHLTSRQSIIDNLKNKTALDNNFKIYRVGLNNDIIDLLILLGI